MRLSIILLFFCLRVFSQDTIQVYKFQDGSRWIQIYGYSDTTEVFLWSNGKRESTIPLHRHGRKYIFTRYDKLGNVVLKREMLGNEPDGKTTFYYKNNPICEVIFSKGIPVDTMVINPKYGILMINYNYHSEVVGGMENEDGSSNVSIAEGPYIHHELRLINTSSPISEKSIYQTSTSDFQGNLFFVLKKDYSNLGMFPASIKLNEIPSGRQGLSERVSYSDLSTYQLSADLSLLKMNGFNLSNLKVTSIGYAP
jgi:hypothetical protein